MRISWFWRLHRDLADRQRHGERLQAETDRQVAETAERVRRMRAVAKPLDRRSEENQFTALIRGIVAGIDLRDGNT